jgi:hypothetical protein
VAGGAHALLITAIAALLDSCMDKSIFGLLFLAKLSGIALEELVRKVF